MTEDEFAAYQSLSEETDDHRWAFGTGFTDPLEGIDASVPGGVDARALAAYCLALGDDALIYSHRLQQWMTRLPELEEETALRRLDRRREKKGSNDEWTHPHDPDAKITKMKDGRTHLAQSGARDRSRDRRDCWRHGTRCRQGSHDDDPRDAARSRRATRSGGRGHR